MNNDNGLLNDFLYFLPVFILVVTIMIYFTNASEERRKQIDYEKDQDQSYPDNDDDFDYDFD